MRSLQRVSDCPWMCAAKPALARERQRVRELARKRFSVGPPTPYTYVITTPYGGPGNYSRIGLLPPTQST